MTTIFVNLTNHPSANWGTAQQNAAGELGRVIDIPFPQVAPTATTEDVRLLADEVVKQVLQLADEPASIVAHVMGEHTLVLNIVTLLKARHVKCVASTTSRNVVMQPDGKKVSVFEFVQFREY